MENERLRVMRLFQEGKISAKEALDFIEALGTRQEEQARSSYTEQQVSGPKIEPAPSSRTGEEEERTETRSSEKSFTEPISDFFERFGKEISSPEAWQKVSTQIQEGAARGAEAIRQATKQFRKHIRSWNVFRARASREFVLPLHPASNKSISISNPIGDVRVNGHASEDIVRVNITIDGQDSQEAERRAHELNIMLEETEHLIMVKIPDLPGLTADIELNLVSSRAVYIKQGQGDTRIKHLSANCIIKAEDSDIKVEDVAGEVEIGLQNGNITLEDIQTNRVEIEGQNVNSSLTHVRGDVNIRTTSGNVSLNDCRGETVTCDIVSGNLFMNHPDSFFGDAHLRVVNGAIRANLTPVSDCRMSLSSLNGMVDCKLVLKDEIREPLRIEGTLGNGRGVLHASVVNGYVLVDKYTATMTP